MTQNIERQNMEIRWYSVMEEVRKAREEEIKTINRINHRMDYQANRRGRGRVIGRGYGNSNN